MSGFIASLFGSKEHMNGQVGPTSPSSAKQEGNGIVANEARAPIPPAGYVAGQYAGQFGGRGGRGGPKRTFTVSKADHGVAVGGKYVSPMPLSAAKKAASKLFAKASAGVRKIQFTLRETTRGAGKGEFQYVANKTKLAKPKVIKRGDTEITVHFTYAVRSLDC
jgi:hypothetical protein